MAERSYAGRNMQLREINGWTLEREKGRREREAI
jgi:hypothetical protein